MPELQALRAGHEQSVFDFELVNRAYFARSISDRGDDYFHQFAEQHKARLAEQALGTGAYFVLVDDDGSVIGRFNLLLVGSGTANLGYRVAERVAGRGVATAAVRDLCQLAAETLGVRTVRAAVADLNVASRKVLSKAGFVPVGPADPENIGGKAGTLYQREVSPPNPYR
jgi:ribosomal-protein-alanine N-acetyltransferase